MSQIIKDKDGKVLSVTPDTGYHKDGTGARDADGVLIAAATDAADATNIATQVAADVIPPVVGAPSVTSGPAKAAPVKRED